MTLNFFQKFIKLESSSSIILFVATLLALLLANSPWHAIYEYLLTTPLQIKFGDFKFSPSLESFINDGLMTLFFLVVSLEVKRELIAGELNTRAKALLPAIAAIGGMLMPAIIFLIINLNHPDYLKGWGIPAATDIAFSLGILSLLGKRVPIALKIFLTALAIIDDLGAIIIIAIFYNHDIAGEYLLFAGVCMSLLMLLNHLNIHRFRLYGILGFLLWLCIIKSGVHATIAGVLLGLTIPMRKPATNTEPLLITLEHKLHPWVAYGILPFFALANANLSFIGMQGSALSNPLVLGITAGLFFGKPIGVCAASWLAIKFKIARLPNSVTWYQIFGTAVLCGMGFTMSLFMGALAFPGVSNPQTDMVKLGVILGSLLAGLCGYLLLRMVKARK